MASAHIYAANNSADVPLVAGTAKTVLQLRSAATRRVWIKEAQISFKSVTASDVPVLVQLVRQTTVGTATALPANNLVADVEGHPAPITTAFETFTVEPTSTGILRTWEVTPIGGVIVYQLPLGDEVEMAVSSFLGLLCTAPQGQNCRAYLKFNE